MSRSLLLAGLLTVGATFPALAGADISAVRSAVNGGGAQQGCHDGAWLPGTLHVDERARPAVEEETAPVFQRSPARADCAFV